MLVKIKDETILKYQNEQRGPEHTRDLRFLLQVWTIEGQLIFEKPLEKPVANWNISRDILIFMEKTDSNVIWVVKLSMTNEPVVYKFNIPQRMVSGNINSFYETAKSNFHIPTEVEVNDEEDKEMN